MSAHQHGAERNRREETQHGKPAEMKTPDGAIVYQGPLSSSTAIVSERWCATCETWTEYRGILSRLFGCRTCGRDWSEESK